MSAAAHCTTRLPGAWALVAACCGALVGCKQPVVGAATAAAQKVGGPALEIAGASVAATGRVVVSLRVTNHGAPVATREAVLELRPHFTLAALSRHPVDGLASWKSLLLTGATIAQLPPGGPGTPPERILLDQRQPGAESSGALSGADGSFVYEFEHALPAGFDPTETLRVGAWLLGAGTAEATSTFDFRPAGGTPAPRDTVLDSNCARCHDAVRSPRGAVGVRMCVTCHTWQNADPDTVDPAAMDGATAATDPNPLDFGRFVHRVHRGKNLPTLYRSSSKLPALPLPGPLDPPLVKPDPDVEGQLPPPFALPFAPGRNTAIAGRRFTVVGPQGRQRVFGQVETRTDNGQSPGKVVASGATFPRDYRDCDACHAGAPQAYEVLYAISRRTCQGCHPEIWFESTPITSAVHFAHPGAPQPDDTACAGCHIAAAAPGQKVHAPLAQIHAPPRASARFSRPSLELVSVSNLVPGGAPTVAFKLFDRAGTLSPPNAPSPACESGATPNPSCDGGATASPVPRAISSLRITVAGPTAPDYSGTASPLSSGVTGNPNPLTLVADEGGVFRYTFASTLPATTGGTWAVILEARRRVAIPLYEAGAFRWPYTGETVTEAAENAIAYVDTAAGTWPGGTPAPRRRVVSQEKCHRCHGELAFHGTRNRVEYCVACHTPERTDWSSSGRPKVNGNVNLAATYDGIEERSLQLKTLVHRLHTGRRTGSAALDLVRPFAYGGSPTFGDRGMFPSDLANCTLCHEGRSYELDVVPADAPPTLANETGTIRHAASAAHVAGEPATPAVTAACLGCHATGASASHVARYTVDGAEQCVSCHLRGTFGVAVAHGLAAPEAAAISATYSSIARDILVPRCASGACHGGSPPAAFPRLDAEVAFEELVEKPSQQASGVMLVKPYAPEESYLLVKSRGDGASLGGVGTPMPVGDAALTPSELAAIEAWIASGAPHD